MRDLIEHIDTLIKSCNPDAKMWGLCHLIEDDNTDRYPSTLEEKAKAVYPDDRFVVNIYHRLLPTTFADDEALSFGRTRTKVNNQPIRTVVFVRMKEDLNRVDDIVNALPETFTVSDDYKFSRVGADVTVNRDSNSVWDDEYSEAYKDKYAKVWNIYAIEWQLQYSKCNVCV